MNAVSEYSFFSRQKRKLDEMYDKLRTEYDSVKRSAIQPANNLFPRAQQDLFAGMPNMMDNSNPLRQGNISKSLSALSWFAVWLSTMQSVTYQLHVFLLLEDSRSFTSSRQIQQIYLLQDWFLPLTLQGGERRCGLPHHGSGTLTLIHLKFLGDLLTWELLLWMLDPADQLDLSLELARTILLQPCGICWSHRWSALCSLETVHTCSRNNRIC